MNSHKHTCRQVNRKIQCDSLKSCKIFVICMRWDSHHGRKYYSFLCYLLLMSAYFMTFLDTLEKVKLEWTDLRRLNFHLFLQHNTQHTFWFRFHWDTSNDCAVLNRSNTEYEICSSLKLHQKEVDFLIRQKSEHIKARHYRNSKMLLHSFAIFSVQIEKKHLKKLHQLPSIVMFSCFLLKVYWSFSGLSS